MNQANGSLTGCIVSPPGNHAGRVAMAPDRGPDVPHTVRAQHGPRWLASKGVPQISVQRVLKQTARSTKLMMTRNRGFTLVASEPR
jgi:hypothetical protein